jgi:hypothetical protein
MLPMNIINQRQNDKIFIDYLKAQRVAYSQCKKYQFVDFISVLIAIILPIIGLINRDYVSFLGAFGVIWTIIYLVVENFRKNKSQQGAKIQEQFDTELFEIPWNDVLCKNKVNKDIQIDLAKRYRSNDLSDWYSKEIGSDIPREVAVLLCQRINFSWELNLRKKFVFSLVTVLLVYYGTIIITSIFVNLGLLDTLILLAPSISFLIYGVQNVAALKSQSRSKEEYLDLIDSKIQAYSLNKTIPDNTFLRQVQDVMFNQRNFLEKIPDWFYNTFRKDNENRTDEIIKSIKTNF